MPPSTVGVVVDRHQHVRLPEPSADVGELVDVVVGKEAELLEVDLERDPGERVGLVVGRPGGSSRRRCFLLPQPCLQQGGPVLGRRARPARRRPVGREDPLDHVGDHRLDRPAVDPDGDEHRPVGPVADAAHRAPGDGEGCGSRAPPALAGGPRPPSRRAAVAKRTGSAGTIDVQDGTRV